MESIIKNVIYLSPSAGLSFVGAYCLWLFSVNTDIFKFVFLLLALVLICAACVIAKYGYDSLERKSKIEAQAHLETEKERTSRRTAEHERAMQKLQARKELGNQKLTRDIVTEAAKRL